jgi:TRAP-type C4-dicarboxylate transport system substrate-binding protein
MKKQIKRVIFCSLVINLSITIFIATANSKTINLKLSHHMPIVSEQHTKILGPWVDKIEKLSEGKVKFTFYPGGALGNPTVQYDILLKGITDIAFVVHHYEAGVFPLTSALRLPFAADSGKSGSAKLWKIYDQYMKNEYKQVKVLWLFSSAPTQFQTTKKFVENLEDLKGMKIRSMGRDVTDVLKILGAVPVNMPITDVYTALERGTVDGMTLPWEVLRPFKLFEVTKYTSVVNIFPVTFGIFMNKKKWDSLPPDIQRLIDDNIGEKQFVLAGQRMDEADHRSRTFCVEKGMKVYTLPEQEKARWKERVRPHLDKWVQDMESKGLPGKEVLGEVF